MLKDLILFEFIKIKNSKILFIIFFFNIFSVLIGSVIYLSNLEFLKNENQLSLVLWGQCSLYSSQIFLPVLIGILCSISWQMEEKNKNWQRMKTIPISDFSFVFSKFLNIQVFNLISSIIYYLLFVISVILLGVPDTPFLLFLFGVFTDG
ncbi:ABC transporter permease [Lactococcus lactis]|uniref:ABC transporter permease n=1 Tax=Lactococcus lactis TaxID=1358 RepID=UPI00168BAB46|nr:ABC transporter permease [Lactococcus lactis]QNT13117.1 ABC transporter permease [Lactococcus lactis subsp. lactis]